VCSVNARSVLAELAVDDGAGEVDCEVKHTALSGGLLEAS